MNKFSRPSDTNTDRTEAANFDFHTRVAAEEMNSESDADIMAFGLAIVRAGNRLQQDMENVIHRPAGSTWAAFRVMFAIRSEGSMSAKRLAKFSSTSPASISSVLHTLEKYGLTKRVPDPDDARSAIVSLTDEGQRVVTDLFLQTNRRMAEWATSFTSDERTMMTALLHRLLSSSPPPLGSEPSREVETKSDITTESV